MDEAFPKLAVLTRAGLAVLLVLLAGCQTAPDRQASTGAGGRALDLPLPDGSHRTVTLEDQGPGARLSDGRHSRTLPVASSHVLAFGVVPEELARAVRQSDAPVLALSGNRREQGFTPDLMELVDPDTLPVAPPPGTGLPLYAPALPRLQGEAFGSERRATLAGMPGNGLALQCAAGEAPAGAELRGPLAGTLDRRNAALRIRMRGAGHFALLVADSSRLAAEDPLVAGEFLAQEGWTDVDVSLPRGQWQAADWQSLTVACPATDGQLEIASMEVVLADREPTPGARALWVWAPAAWQDDGSGLIAHVQASGASEVFISVPLADEKCLGAACAVAAPDRLAAFLQNAADAGLHVWAVAGDPLAVLPEEREAWLGRAGAYARFNQTQAPSARLAGVQYDIEPYLVPGYGQSPEAWNRRFLDLLAGLRASGGKLPLDVVVPWWFGQGGSSPATLLDALASRVDRVTVMDYRTDPGQVVQSALPFVEWGRRSRRQVRIAVESGPLPDLEWRRYASAGAGELWMIELGGQSLYVLLDAPVMAEGTARAFANRGGHLVKATQTTFYQRPEALWRMVARLEDVFGATTAFAGVAIHGLDQAWY